jgi:exosortase E/protease (VPEID-CTERM system)
MVAFLGGFIVVHRRALRLGRALWVLPMAVAVSWLANVARVVVLVLIGAHVSPDIAVGGFHSKAGWLLFCVLAFGFVVAMRRTPSLWREAAEGKALEPLTEDSAPYLLPLLALLATALVTGLFSTGLDELYGARVAVVGVVLWAYRGSYVRSFTRPGLESIAIGVIVFVIWIALVPRRDPDGVNAASAALAQLGGLGAAAWIVLRIVGSVSIVPLAEELAFRGYLLRRMSGSDFGAVPYETFRLAPFVGSSLAFGLLHSELVAGTLAGMAYALAVQRRGRLTDAIVAHAITNALIAVDVLVNDAWALW